MPPATLSRLLEVVESPRAVEDLAAYFEPDRAADAPPRFAGSRFEFLGGGDRPETANRITPDDLVAVTLLSMSVPGDVALQLLEGDPGGDVAGCLGRIPVDVGIEDPAAHDLFFAAGSPVRLARDLLEEPHGMDWFIAHTLLARKRPRLIPAYDRVARCLTGLPDESWGWHLDVFAGEAGVADRLAAARRAAGVPDRISTLRALDVVLWMRHRPVHLENGCPGLI
ncbi:DUF6308 family protein [Blastococcus sp. URHD0036]|uniref:DUF6308 family protein n=1 Tax=Blastococcus sp. URHD0036 TaxID=1380356 RepID=UPI00068B735C|nr:DUF6308 family protein [Blastococcus sp. URHD0036]